MEWGADFFFAHEFGELGELVDVMNVAFLEQGIGEHFAQRRREAHREAEIDFVVAQTTHHAQKRDIRLCHGLEQPVFFEEVGVFGVTDEREVCMQDDAEIAL